MDSVRAEHVIRRMTNAMVREIKEWEKVEKCAEYITERPYLHGYVNIHKDVDFKFEQMYNPERAAAVQDQINDLINAERWTDA